MKFDQEPIAAVWNELVYLAGLQTTELKLPWPLKPNLEAYKALERIGGLCIFTMREEVTGQGNLVGYCSMSVVLHQHYEGLFAQQDGLYVKTEHRGPHSIRFMEWVDQQVIDMGVAGIVRSVTPALDYGRLLERMGYEPGDQTFIRKV